MRLFNDASEGFEWNASGWVWGILEVKLKWIAGRRENVTLVITNDCYDLHPGNGGHLKTARRDYTILCQRFVTDAVNKEYTTLATTGTIGTLNIRT